MFGDCKLTALVLTCGLFLSPHQAMAGCDANAILRDNVVHYNSDIETFISYVNSVTKSQSSTDNTNGSVDYDGFDLTYGNAKSLADYFSSHTNYQLSETERLSLLTSSLDQGSVAAYIACLRDGKDNIVLTAPQGADRLSEFVVNVHWQPTYGVEPLKGTNSRPIALTVSNGSVAVGDEKKTININGDAQISISRTSLDQPISITAEIDGHASDFFVLPAVPTKGLRIVPKEASSYIERSGNHGTEALANQFCVTADNDSYLLTDSAAVTLTGGGYEWEPRTHIEKVAPSNPLQFCAILKSDGVPGDDEKYYHKSEGHISILEAQTFDIKTK